MDTKWGIGLLALCASSLLVGPAQAAGPDARRRGDALLREGLAAAKRGDYEQARVDFVEASALIPGAAVWRDLGLTEMKLGRPVQALRHYRLASASADLAEDKRDILQQNIQDAYAATGHIRVLASAGAIVSIDGDAVEDGLNEPVDVMPGRHTVQAAAGPGAARSVRAEVDAAPNVLVTADVRMVDVTPEPPPAASNVLAAQPLEPPTPAPPPAEAMPLSAESPTPYWTTRRSVGAVFTGAGLVSLGLSAFFWSQAENDRNSALAITSGASTSACTGAKSVASCATLENDYAATRSDATWTVLLAGLGGAAVVAGAVLILWPQAASSHVAVAPMIVPRGGGLQLRGDL